MPRPPDAYLKSHAFRSRLIEADRMAAGLDLPRWPTRITWVTITEGPQVARRFAQRRCDYKTSPAWSAYCNLLASGLLDEEQDTYLYNESPEWTEGNGIWLWLTAFIYVAAGSPVPDSFFGR